MRPPWFKLGSLDFEVFGFLNLFLITTAFIVVFERDDFDYFGR
jgi:hypothetical protein